MYFVVLQWWQLCFSCAQGLKESVEGVTVVHKGKDEVLRELQRCQECYSCVFSLEKCV